MRDGASLDWATLDASRPPYSLGADSGWSSLDERPSRRLPWAKPRLALPEKEERIARTNKFQTKQHATTGPRGLITVEL